MVVLQITGAIGYGIRQSGWASGTVVSRWSADGPVGSIKKKRTFLDGPPVVAAFGDAIDFLDIILRFTCRIFWKFIINCNKTLYAEEHEGI